MSRRALVAWLLAGAALAMAGCAPTPSPPPTSPPPGATSGPLAACALVPGLGTLVGREPIASPNGFSTPTGDRCQWVLARDPSRYVGLTLGPARNHGATIDAFGPGETVEALGDDARWWAANRTLSVVTGERSFQVDLQLDAAEVTLPLAEAIAAAVLSELEEP